MWVADFRNTSTTLHSDVVLPAATWYEKHDLSSTDMHPFMHSFNAAVNPPWEARTDFEVFQTLARLVVRRWPPATWTPRRTSSRLRSRTTPRTNPDHGRMASFPRQTWTPGETMPKLVPIERDYTQVGHKFDTHRPARREGRTWPRRASASTLRRKSTQLGDLNGRARWTAYAGEGVPLCDTDSQGARAWSCASRAPPMARWPPGLQDAGRACRHRDGGHGRRRRRKADHLRGHRHAAAYRYHQPRVVGFRARRSPLQRPSCQNVECRKPWHTLTGRPQFYVDHDWMQDMGESLPIFRPPLDLRAHRTVRRPVGDHASRSAEGRPRSRCAT